MNKSKTMILLLLILLLTNITIPTAKAEETKDDSRIKVVVAIERFSVGQGYFLEPTLVETERGSSCYDVLQKIENMKNIKIHYFESSYLGKIESIDNSDAGIVHIPQLIQNMPVIDLRKYGGYDNYWCPPNNKSFNDYYEENHGLRWGSYHALSGWYFSKNGKVYEDYLKDTKVQDMDVIRIQFSVYSAGRSLGYDYVPPYDISPPITVEQENTLKLADKDELTKQVALAGSKTELQEVRKQAIQVLEKFDASQQEVDTVSALLQGKTLTLTKPKIKTIRKKKAYVVSAKKQFLSKKIKIKLRAIDGADKYQVEIAKTKKFKRILLNRTVKKKNITFFSKKLKNQNKLYIRVRGVQSYKGKNYRSKWSKVKKITIRKMIPMQYMKGNKWSATKKIPLIIWGR